MHYIGFSLCVLLSIISSIHRDLYCLGILQFCASDIYVWLSILLQIPTFIHTIHRLCFMYWYFIVYISMSIYLWSLWAQMCTFRSDWFQVIDITSMIIENDIDIVNRWRGVIGYSFIGFFYSIELCWYWSLLYPGCGRISLVVFSGQMLGKMTWEKLEFLSVLCE